MFWVIVIIVQVLGKYMIIRYFDDPSGGNIIPIYSNLYRTDSHNPY